MKLNAILYLMYSQGITSEAVRWLVLEGLTTLGLPEEPQAWDGPAHQRIINALRARGLLSAARVQWPEIDKLADVRQRLARAHLRLHWRGTPEYPQRLQQRMAETAPSWVWEGGSDHRLERLSCAIIGSRHTPQIFLTAAQKLARGLSEAGVTVVSGLATGADQAAHEGAIERGSGGTIAIPPKGILRVDAVCSNTYGQMTCLGISQPDAPFSPHLAVRRNDVIAAMGDGLVLVASGLNGGSSYAVRWALAHGTPIWCFHHGPATPPGNRYLLRLGQARPLKLNEPVEAWLDRILPELTAQHRHPASADSSAGPHQPDWVMAGDQQASEGEFSRN